MSVVALRNLRETGDDLRKELSPIEHDVKILERELPHLLNDGAILVARPFRLVWDPTTETASTDCIAEIRISPRPFIRGERDVGRGTFYHECGHIVSSPYGAELMARAERDDGPVLAQLVNIILDRKDDYETVNHAPGFADVLRKRLLAICTLARRERYAQVLRGMDPEVQSKFLRNAKPQDCYEDFFFAAKWHKRPRFKVTHKAMKYLKRSRLSYATPDKLLWIAKRVKEILGEPKKERGKAEQAFLLLCFTAHKAEWGGKLSPELLQALNLIVTVYVAGLRKSGKEELIKHLKVAGLVYPGPLSVGLEGNVPLKRFLPKQEYEPMYGRLLSSVKSAVGPLVQKLRKIDNPSEIELFGRDDGELDLTESARIATGLSGYHMETVTERDIDAEIHLAIDTSGSMSGRKALLAKQIAVVFSEAIRALDPSCLGRIWSFNSDCVGDYGPPRPDSAFIAVDGSGGNSDTHMLKYVGTELGKSRKRRKVLLVLCDDGPDDMQLARKISQQLMARGIIVVHLLVGVHGTPDIYPIELLYTSMEECLSEFGDLIETIISNLR